MPNEQATFTTKIVISGGTDPSLLRTLGYTEKQMLAMNKLTQNLATNAAVSVKHFAKFSPELQKANIQSDKLGGSLKRVGEIVAGLGINDILVGGLRSAVGLAGQLGERFKEFASEASKLSSQRELLTKGLGNLLGNQAQADLIYKQMFDVAKASPFQAKDLVHPIQRFVASGMNLNQARWLATRQGDLMAGIGGGPEEMDRATLAFQEINAKGYANSKQLNTQLGALGIPVQKTLEEMLHVNPEQLDKMIRKHQITSDIIQKMVEVLTGPNGMFFESMKKFAETFQGLQTTIIDEFQYFEADFGDILNDVTKLIYEFAGGPDIWNRVNDYMANLKSVNKAILTWATSIPTTDIMRQISPYLGIVEGVFHSFNQWLGSFFDYADIPTQGQVMVLNQSGIDMIQNTLRFGKMLFQEIWDFTQMDEFIKLVSLGTQIAQLTSQAGNLQKLRGVFGVMLDILRVVADFLTMNFAKGGVDITKAVLNIGKLGNYSGNMPGVRDYWPTNVPYFASGGVVNSPTLGVIGESGPEAILPLSGASTLDDLAEAISNLNSFLMYAFPAGTPGGGIGAGYGGIRGGFRGSMLANTQYGPGVDYIDANGRVHGTPDSDSSSGIGHIHGVRYNLGPGSVAMHSEYAEGTLHLKPHQWFRNPRNGRLQRWDDTSGAANRENIDEYVPRGNTYNINIHAIDSKSFEGRIKEHARTIRKHIEGESNHQAKLNSKALV